jgi:hypothetical protein
MLRWDDITNQLHDIAVALIQEAVFWFEPHKSGYILQHGHIGAIVHFFFWGRKVPIEILHIWQWIFRLQVVSPSNISYHVIHLIDINVSIWLIGYHRLHLPVLVPQKVVQHKPLLSKVSRHPSDLTPAARVIRFTTTTSKS